MDRDVPLTERQLASLLDILTHAEAAAEVTSFTHPSAVANYGPPFTPPSDPSPAVTSPLLQTLLLRLVLPAPGICDLPPEFWSERVQGLLSGLAASGLSESYEKGSVGTRRTLATGASAVIEGVARGCLAGFPRSGLLNDKVGKVGEGEEGKEGEALEAGWDAFVRGVVHGGLIDGVCEWLEGTDDLEGYSPVVKAAAEYAIVNVASLLHHIFAVTPEGQYLLKLLSNAHKLVPYAVIRQILRLGNAATMLNSLLKLLLAKFGLATLSNWVGFTQGADEGMNLLQRIISGALYWDSYEFRKTCDKIEKAKNAPSSKCLKALRKHAQGPREKRDEMRKLSAEKSRSVVLTILDGVDPKLSASLSWEQHDLCLQYYAAMLSTRDRDEIVDVLCHSNPDLLSQAVRDIVGVYEPMIRDIHATIDLSEHLDNARAFIDDFLAVSASEKVDGEAGEGGYRLPTVENYVELLRRHKGSVYLWLHQASSKCPQVRDQVKEWAKDMTRAFRPEDSPGNIDGTSLLHRLELLFAELPGEKQAEIRAVLDRHAAYLASVHRGSENRAEAVSQTNGRCSASGPGIYLASWQSLLDGTPITPDAKGGVRSGRDVLDRTTPGKPGMAGEVSVDGVVDVTEAMVTVEAEGSMRPDGSVVVGALGDGFKGLLREVAMRVARMER